MTDKTKHTYLIEIHNTGGRYCIRGGRVVLAVSWMTGEIVRLP